jgi:K+-sensing histidine kinase KdpD
VKSAADRPDSGGDPIGASVRTDAAASPFALVPSLAEPSELAAVSEMLRAPLTELAASAGLLLDDLGVLRSDQQREIASSMQRRAIGLHYLVENLLLAATIRDGHFHVRARSTSLADVIDEAAPTAMPLLTHRGQELHIRVTEPLPNVSADSRRIGQSLMNLIYNAHVRAEANTAIDLIAERQRDAIRVAIADHGVGPTDEAEARFAPPSGRIEWGLRSGDAVGLGLSIVQAIISAHRGQVGVAQRIGGGAWFWFELPLNRGDVSTLPERRTSLVPERLQGRALGSSIRQGK